MGTYIDGLIENNFNYSKTRVLRKSEVIFNTIYLMHNRNLIWPIGNNYTTAGRPRITSLKPFRSAAGHRVVKQPYQALECYTSTLTGSAPLTMFQNVHRVKLERRQIVTTRVIFYTNTLSIWKKICCPKIRRGCKTMQRDD